MEIVRRASTSVCSQATKQWARQENNHLINYLHIHQICLLLVNSDWTNSKGLLVCFTSVFIIYTNLMLTYLCVITGSLPGDLSEGSDQCSRHQDVQSACHDWQPNRRLHRDLLGIWRWGQEQNQEHHHQLCERHKRLQCVCSCGQLQRHRGKGATANQAFKCLVEKKYKCIMQATVELMMGMYL